MNRHKLIAGITTVLFFIATILCIVAIRTPLVSVRIVAPTGDGDKQRVYEADIMFFNTEAGDKMLGEKCDILKKRLLGSAVLGLISCVFMSICFVLLVVRLVELYGEEEDAARRRRRVQRLRRRVAGGQQYAAGGDGRRKHRRNPDLAVDEDHEQQEEEEMESQQQQQQQQNGDEHSRVATTRNTNTNVSLNRNSLLPTFERRCSVGGMYFISLLCFATFVLYSWRCLVTECTSEFPLYFGIAGFDDTGKIGPTLAETPAANSGSAAPLATVAMCAFITGFILSVIGACFDKRGCCACCSCCRPTLCCPQVQCCQECWRDDDGDDDDVDGGDEVIDRQGGGEGSTTSSAARRQRRRINMQAVGEINDKVMEWQTVNIHAATASASSPTAPSGNIVAVGDDDASSSGALALGGSSVLGRGSNLPSVDSINKAKSAEDRAKKGEAGSDQDDQQQQKQKNQKRGEAAFISQAHFLPSAISPDDLSLQVELPVKFGKNKQ